MRGPYQHPGGAGMPAFVAGDRDIDGADIMRTAPAAEPGPTMNVAAGRVLALDQRRPPGRAAGGRRELGPAVRASAGVRRQ